MIAQNLLATPAKFVIGIILAQKVFVLLSAKKAAQNNASLLQIALPKVVGTNFSVTMESASKRARFVQLNAAQTLTVLQIVERKQTAIKTLQAQRQVTAVSPTHKVNVQQHVAQVLIVKSSLVEAKSSAIRKQEPVQKLKISALQNVPPIQIVLLQSAALHLNVFLVAVKMLAPQLKEDVTQTAIVLSVEDHVTNTVFQGQGSVVPN